MENSMTLYELTQAQRQFAHMGLVFDEETGEVLFEEPEEIELALSQKAEACAVVHKERAATIQMLKDEREILTKRIKSLESGQRSFEGYLDTCVEMNGGAIETPRSRISVRKSSAVSIIDEDAIPEEFTKTKVTKSIDRAAIKNALKDGVDVPGACIVVNRNVQVN